MRQVQGLGKTIKELTATPVSVDNTIMNPSTALINNSNRCVLIKARAFVPRRNSVR